MLTVLWCSATSLKSCAMKVFGCPCAQQSLSYDRSNIGVEDWYTRIELRMN